MTRKVAKQNIQKTHKKRRLEKRKVKNEFRIAKHRIRFLFFTRSSTHSFVVLARLPVSVLFTAYLALVAFLVLAVVVTVGVIVIGGRAL